MKIEYTIMHVHTYIVLYDTIWSAINCQLADYFSLTFGKETINRIFDWCAFKGMDCENAIVS